MKRNWGSSQFEEEGRFYVETFLDEMYFHFAREHLFATDGKVRNQPKNPLTIYGSINARDEPPFIKFTLNSILSTAIMVCEEVEQGADELEEIAAGLEKLAKRLRRAVKKGRAPERP